MNYAHGVGDKLMESEELAQQAANNTKPEFALGNIRDKVTDAVIEHRSANNTMAGQILADDNKLKSFIDIMIDMAWHGFEDITYFIAIDITLCDNAAFAFRWDQIVWRKKNQSLAIYCVSLSKGIAADENQVC